MNSNNSIWPLLALVVALACRSSERPPTLVLATTTSVVNSGLLDVLLPTFEQRNGTNIRTIPSGSGLALQLLARGEADVVISHAPAAESAALAEHPQWSYRKIMFNDFILVGPPADPARVKASTTIEEAMRRIAASGTFVSRGDRSGTHERELELWRRAGTEPAEARRPTSGTGMGATLRIASQQSAYTLADRATYAQLSHTLQLIPVFEGGPSLVNTYAVIVDPAVDSRTPASEFARWLGEGEGRTLVAGFTGRGTVPLFRVWPADRPRSNPANLPF